MQYLEDIIASMSERCFSTVICDDFNKAVPKPAIEEDSKYDYRKRTAHCICYFQLSYINNGKVDCLIEHLLTQLCIGTKIGSSHGT